MSERRAKHVRRLMAMLTGTKRAKRLPKHAPEPDLSGWEPVAYPHERENARRRRQAGSS